MLAIPFVYRSTLARKRKIHQEIRPMEGHPFSNALPTSTAAKIVSEDRCAAWHVEVSVQDSYQPQWFYTFDEKIEEEHRCQCMSSARESVFTR